MTKNLSAAGDDDLQKLTREMWADVTRLVDPFGGDAQECGLAEPDYVPFQDYFAGARVR